MDEKKLNTELSEEEKFNSFDDDDDDDDIEFDDNINIEALTQQLQQHVDVGEAANMTNEDFNKEPENPNSFSVSVNGSVPDSQAAVDFPKMNCKKYVVYITPNNVDYVDSLSIDERTELINNIIFEKQENNKKSKLLKVRQNYFKHLIVVCLTVIISFPVLFYAVNKSLQATINNYQQSQENFQKLYKERGKINSYQKMDLK
ncbi:hypothetical protein IJ818_04480 [bacterium]|nr:hypothetical protein [bacterium]